MCCPISHYHKFVFIYVGLGPMHISGNQVLYHRKNSSKGKRHCNKEILPACIARDIHSISEVTPPVNTIYSDTPSN